MNARPLLLSHQPAPATDLFILNASKSALEKKEAAPAAGQQMMQSEMMQLMQVQYENLSPAHAVGQTSFVRVVGEMIMNNNDSQVNFERLKQMNAYTEG